MPKRPSILQSIFGLGARESVLPRLAMLSVCGLCAALVGRALWRDRPRPERRVEELLTGPSRAGSPDALTNLLTALLYARSEEEKAAIIPRIEQNLAGVRPADSGDFLRALLRITGGWQQVHAALPTCEPAARVVVALHGALARATDDAASWALLADRCRKILAASPADAETRRVQVVALAYCQDRGGTLSPEQLRLLSDHLPEMALVFPEDAELAYAQALLILAKAGRTEGFSLRRQLRSAAERVLADFRERRGRTPGAEIYGLAVRLVNQVAEQGYRSGVADDVLRALARLEAELDPASLPSSLAVRFARLLAAGDQRMIGGAGGTVISSGLTRAERFLRKCLEGRAEAPGLRLALAANLVAQDRVAEAVPMLSALQAFRPAAVDVESTAAWGTAIEAAALRAEVALKRLAMDPDDSAAESVFREALAFVGSLYAGSPHLARLEGTFAFVRGRPEAAATLLERAARALGDGLRDETLLTLGMALQATGEHGAAVARLTAYLRSPGRSAETRFEAMVGLCEALLMLRRFSEAEEVVAALRTAGPRLPEPVVLEARALLGRQASGGAGPAADQVPVLIDRLTEVRGRFRGEALRLAARLHLLGDDGARAVAVLERRLGEAPRDVDALALLLAVHRQLGSHRQARTVLAEAAAGAGVTPAPEIPQADEPMPPSLEHEVVATLQAASADDAVDGALVLHRFYRRAGRRRDAAEALARAVAAGATRPEVVTRRFEVALADEDLATAEAVLAEAGEAVAAPRVDQWRGALAMLRGEVDVALASLERATDAWPLCSRGWGLLGDAALQAGDPDRAVACFERAVELKPDYELAWERLVRIHRQAGRRDQARDALANGLRYRSAESPLIDHYFDFVADDPATDLLRDRARYARSHPGDHANRRAIARMLMESGRMRLAGAVLNRLVAEAPDSIANVCALARWRRQQGDPEGAARSVQEYLTARGARNSARDWLMAAALYVEMGLPEAAEAAFTAARECENPQTLPATRAVAEYRYGRREFDAALPLFRRVVTANRHPAAWMRLVAVLIELGRYDEAARELAGLRPRAAGNPELLMLEARIAVGQERREQAIESLDAFVQARPQDARGLAWRGYCRMDFEGVLSQRQAQSDLERAALADPGWDWPRRLLAELSYRQERYDRAIPHLEALLDLRPADVRPRLMLADAYFREQRFHSLDQLLDASQERFPDRREWYELRARLHAARGRLPQAADAWRRLLTDRPTATVLREYVLALLRLRRNGEALSGLEEAAAIVADNPELLAIQARLQLRAGRRDDAIVSLRASFAAVEKGAGDGAEAVAQLRGRALGADPRAILQPLPATPSRDLLLAAAAMDRAEFTAAITIYRALAGRLGADHPLREATVAGLAGALVVVKQFDEAGTLYRQLIAAHPDNPIYANNLAHLLVESGQDPRLAVTMAREALARSWGDPVQRAAILDTLGFAQFKAGMPNRAINALQRSLRFHNRAATRLRLGEVLLEQGKATEALEQAGAAENAPDAGTPAMAAAIADFTARVFQRVEQDEAVSLRDVGTLHRRARALSQVAATAPRAINVARQALAVCTDDGQRAALLTTLGYAQVRAGYPGNAEKTLRRSLELRESHSARLTLARALVALKRFQEAADELSTLHAAAAKAGDTALAEEVRMVRQDLAEGASVAP